MASKAKSQNGILETIKTVFWALLIAGVFRTVFFQPFWIPSGSMKDTLLVGDFLFVNKMAYGYSQYSCPLGLCGFLGEGRILASAPQRGDVVVFRHPVTGEDFIKRLIGLPGDTVQMRDGQLVINGKPVPQQPAGTFHEVYEKQGPMGYYPRCENGPVGEGGDCTSSRFLETLPDNADTGAGVTHSVLNIDTNGFGDNSDVFTVPDNNYFFMGDNRDNSMDSRFAQAAGGVGFVPAKYLVGRADRVIFSSAGRSMLYFWTWRPDRFLKAVE